MSVRSALEGPLQVQVRGLSAGQRATLDASWPAFGGHEWRSRTELRASASGAATLRGVDGMRFLWGMRPVGAPWKHPFFAPPARGPSNVSLSVAVNGTTVARATLSRRVTPASVQLRTLTPRRAPRLSLRGSPRRGRLWFKNEWSTLRVFAVLRRNGPNHRPRPALAPDERKPER